MPHQHFSVDVTWSVVHVKGSLHASNVAQDETYILMTIYHVLLEALDGLLMTS
jgi:hypothetical protein